MLEKVMLCIVRRSPKWLEGSQVIVMVAAWVCSGNQWWPRCMCIVVSQWTSGSSPRTRRCSHLYFLALHPYILQHLNVNIFTEMECMKLLFTQSHSVILLSHRRWEYMCVYMWPILMLYRSSNFTCTLTFSCSPKIYCIHPIHNTISWFASTHPQCSKYKHSFCRYLT